ncbi:hypothetical protein MBLNU230_g1233t1 [Neophaeotheca triangularis]
MENLDPAPKISNISIVSHIVTVEHQPALTAANIARTIEAAGYEVFDTISDTTTLDEKLSTESEYDALLEESVARWDPSRRSESTDETSRLLHLEHCQMCAAQTDAKRTERMQSYGTFSGSSDSRPLYEAILAIEGMTCSSCVGNVSGALESLDFVEKADVSLVGHSATVRLRSSDPEQATEELITAVEDGGYDAQLTELKDVVGKRQASARNQKWQATYAIDGMTCSSCVGTISSAVEKLDFVDAVDINLVGHSGAVTFTGKENEPHILAAIDESGYDAALTDLKSLAKQDDPAATRGVSLRIDGMHCQHCPERVVEALHELKRVKIQHLPALDHPVVTISYIPDAPTFTIRRITEHLTNVDSSFTVSIHKPKSIEQRSREMLRKETKAIFLRVLLAVVAAIPSLVIGVIYMNVVSYDDPSYRYLMQPVHGVSRAEWATFVTATPVYLFAADHFHRRTAKEVFALWRPRSSVPIAKRFYRFGSMNMLISLGTTIAYFSSLVELAVAAKENTTHPEDSATQSYFDSVVFLTMFLLLGRLAEASMKAKSGDAVSALGNLRPAEATLVKQAGEDDPYTLEKMSVDLVDTGDFIRIAHGASPPCDGTLLDESAALDESSLTGESRIVGKKQGDAIYSGTINRGTAITIKVTGPAGASMLDSIIQVVREGQSKRAPVERVADLLTAYFVPVIVLIAIITWLTWLGLGLSGIIPTSWLEGHRGGWPSWSLQFAIAVFVIACPCGLGLAAPTALLVGGGLAAKHGILVKGGGEAFQEASNLDAVVFDKTGTLTEGVEPKMVGHRILEDSGELSQATVLGVLKGMEENSNHPLARAAVSYAASHSPVAVKVSQVEEVAGKGLKAAFEVSGTKPRYEALVGNEALLNDYGVSVSSGASGLIHDWTSSGYSVMLLAIRVTEADWKLLAVFAASDPIRPEAPEVIAALQARGVDVWMLSGDSPGTARAVGSQVGIAPDHIIAGVLPAEKADKVKYLQRAVRPRRHGRLQGALIDKRARATVAMVGDGINDAPALAAADVGIAIASGSDIAVQSAAFVLVHSDLNAVLTLVSLARVVFRRVVLNFIWAAMYNMLALPIAAGVLYPITTSEGSHVRLDPAWAALAMALSSLSVVASSLLLRTRIPGIGFRE